MWRFNSDAAHPFLLQYYGERTLFSTASKRCDQMFCPPSQRPSCGFARCQGEEHIWAATSCTIKAKVDTETGKVAIVHEPEDVSDEDIASIIKPHTATFFGSIGWEATKGAFLTAKILILAALPTMGSVSAKLKSQRSKCSLDRQPLTKRMSCLPFTLDHSSLLDPLIPP